jgi:hypothetical protein
MDETEVASEIIFREISSENAEVRADYMKAFGDDAKVFAAHMARAVVKWTQLDKGIKGRETAFVVALTHAAITLHIQSMACFLSGHVVAAGNLFRQVTEAIALALLCSGKHGTVLPRFMEGKYSSSAAVRDVLRQGRRLQLKADGLNALKASEDFYHRYSHITQLTLGNLISFSEDNVYVGSAFDKGKIDAYQKEVAGRIGLARVFPNFVEAVSENLATW